MSEASRAHVKAMYRVMKYVVGTPNRGKTLEPEMPENISEDMTLKILGRSDSDYAKDPIKRRSVSGGSTSLQSASISTVSRMQRCVTLSVTEAEYKSGAETVQDMLYGMRVLESIGFKVEKPTVLEMDNKGAIDLTNNWNAGGRTRHIDVCHHFMRELKEEGLLEVKWIPTSEMSSDLFTKNLSAGLFEKHSKVYVGEDEYMSLEGESVGEYM